jgi:hypothetical protein
MRSPQRRSLAEALVRTGLPGWITGEREPNLLDTFREKVGDCSKVSQRLLYE